MTDYAPSAVNAVKPLIPSTAVSGIAGGSFTVGDAVVFNSSEVWVKADASAASTAKGLVGICVSCGTRRSDGSVVSGDKVDVVVHGRVAGWSGLNGGTDYYLSDTAGKIADAAGTVTRFIGQANSTTVLFVNAVGPATSA